MDNNKSDTISERKKAQRDFLELKRMQSGELVPDGPPAEIKPKTFKEKIVNFWFHYKVHTLFIVFFTVIFAVGITQCAANEKYDGRVVLYIDRVCTDAETEIFKDYLTPYFTDTDGDGEVSIQILNCAYTNTGTYDMDYSSALSAKLQSVISGEENVQLFIVDPVKLKQLNSISAEIGDFFVETSPFPEEIYETAKEQNFEFPEGLVLGRRVVSGTMIENAENIDVYIKQSEDVMAKFKK